MRYSIYIQTSETSTQVFLQSSSTLFNLKKDKATLDRWMYEMGVVVTTPETAFFTIFEDGTQIFTKKLVGFGSRTWQKV